MYCPTPRCSGNRLTTAAFGLGVVLLLFAIVPIANHINIHRHGYFGGDLSALAMSPPDGEVSRTRLPTSVHYTVDDGVKVPKLEAERATTAAPIDKISMPVPTLEPMTFSEEVKLGLVFDVTDLDYVPMPIRRIPPAYPERLSREGVDGRAVVEFQVDPNGRVSDVQVVAATHAEFGASVVQAVLNWRFVPGMIRGEKVTFKMRLPVAFKIVDEIKPDSGVQIAGSN